MSGEGGGVDRPPPPKRPRRAYRLSDGVRQQETDAIIEQQTENKMQAFTAAKARANCCAKQCIKDIPDEFAIESIRTFRSVSFEVRCAILHGVKCVTSAGGQKMALRGLKKSVCLKCFLLTLGVSLKTWHRVKDDSGWHLGNVEVVQHGSKNREQPYNFEKLGGVKLTAKIIKEIARDFCMYSPGR